MTNLLSKKFKPIDNLKSIDIYDLSVLYRENADNYKQGNNIILALQNNDGTKAKNILDITQVFDIVNGKVIINNEIYRIIKIAYKFDSSVIDMNIYVNSVQYPFPISINTYPNFKARVKAYNKAYTKKAEELIYAEAKKQALSSEKNFN